MLIFDLYQGHMVKKKFYFVWVHSIIVATQPKLLTVERCSFKCMSVYQNLELIKRPARDACLCMGKLQAPPAAPALPAPAALPAPHYAFLITL